MEYEEERNNQPCKTQKRNPFSPEIMKSKGILLLLGNSLCDSEATQFNRVSIIIIKVLRLVPASFFTNLHRLENSSVYLRSPLDAVSRSCGLPAPSCRGLGSKAPAKSRNPRLCAVTERSSPAVNKPRQAQAEPASGSSLRCAPPGPGAGDASLPPEIRGVGALD